MRTFSGFSVRCLCSLTEDQGTREEEVLSNMSQSQEMVPSGSGLTFNAVEDTNMAGSNGSPLVEYPDDRVGPMRDAP